MLQDNWSGVGLTALNDEQRSKSFQETAGQKVSRYVVSLALPFTSHRLSENVSRSGCSTITQAVCEPLFVHQI